MLLRMHTPINTCAPLVAMVVVGNQVSKSTAHAYITGLETLAHLLRGRSAVQECLGALKAKPMAVGVQYTVVYSTTFCFLVEPLQPWIYISRACLNVCTALLRCIDMGVLVTGVAWPKN